MPESKGGPLTAMWQVDVPQIIAMRAVIGWSSQGRLNPFTSAPRTPAKTKKMQILITMICIFRKIKGSLAQQCQAKAIRNNVCKAGLS